MPDTTTQPITTEIKLRIPVDMLHGVELWARAHDIPRSRAIRLLMWRGLAYCGPVEPESPPEPV